MFEAIHGSAPDIAGKDMANPSGLINGALMMLVHLGMADVAANIENAWLKTLEDGIHTGDIYKPEISKEKVGTQAFADAIIERLGMKPLTFSPVEYNKDAKPIAIKRTYTPHSQNKELLGVDVFIDWAEGDRNPDILGKALEAAQGDTFKLKMITNRGVKVYPGGQPETYKTDHWRCRFVKQDDAASVSNADVVQLLGNIANAGLDFIKTEQLYQFDGVRGYSLGQGE